MKYRLRLRCLDAAQPCRYVAPIGLAIAHLATTPDGDPLAGPGTLRAAAKALARAQSLQARRKKESKQRRRPSWRVGKVHRRVAHGRRHHPHKLATEAANKDRFVGVEALRVVSMTASAARTAAATGNNVRAKSGPKRQILDQGWGEMRRQLADKLGWSGGVRVAVDPRNISRRRSARGHAPRDNRTSQASFACVGCGHAMHADADAAKSLLAAAMAAALAGVGWGKRRGRRRDRRPVSSVSLLSPQGSRCLSAGRSQRSAGPLPCRRR